MKHRARAALPGVALVLLVLLGAWVILAPSEARLGSLIKLVYVHAALVWVGMIAFSTAGVLGLVALIVRRPIWYEGTEAAATAALILWIAYSASAIAVTGLTWGQWIAWGEPRVRATALILGAAVLLGLTVRLVQHRDFTAATSVVLGCVSWIAVRRAEAIRHPIDPIGGSGSVAIQTYAALIMVTVAGLWLTIVLWLWTGKRRATSKSREVVES